MGEQIKYIVVDAKAINHVDLTGCEMLEMLAESLKPRKQGLIVANLKGPASRCLIAAGVPGTLKKHGSHLCVDMEQALAIVSGEDDGLQSHAGVHELCKRAQTAEIKIKSANKSFYAACKSPKDLCTGQPFLSTNGSSGTSSPSRQPSSPKTGPRNPSPKSKEIQNDAANLEACVLDADFPVNSEINQSV